MKSVPERKMDGVVNPAKDFFSGIGNMRVWLALALHDIKQRYRRSFLGPFWFVLNNLIFISVLGTLYAEIFSADAATYVPYLSAGFITWQLIASSLLEGSNGMVEAEPLIKQINSPISTHAMRVASRNFIILLHNIPLLVFFPLYFDVQFGIELWFLPLMLLVLFLNSIWVCVIFGLLGARFRDIQPTMHNVVTISFFFTPILWNAEFLGKRAVYVEFNPFFHFIDFVRAPLTGEAPGATSLTVVLIITIVGLVCAWLSLTIFRNRVAFWL